MANCFRIAQSRSTRTPIKTGISTILTSETNSIPTHSNPAGLERAMRCAQIADEYRGRDIRILDLTEVTPEFDYFVIATGTSRRQMHAIVEEVDRQMKNAGSKRIGVEGYDANQWILQDYGDVVLHVFDEQTRLTYDLERLWGDAKQVPFESSRVDTTITAEDSSPSATTDDAITEETAADESTAED